MLSITANPAPAGVNGQYTSGHLDTQGTYSQKYGYFEMSAKMPAAGSNASVDSGGDQGGGAFWLLPTSGAWPPELDVFESTSWGGVFTAHTGVGGHSAETNWANIDSVSTAFHRYGVDWEQDQITWYVDGKEVYHTATPADMHDPMYMLVNLYTSQQGGTPGTMQVDYVRAYADGAGGGVTPPASSASQTTTDASAVPTASAPSAPTASAPTAPVQGGATAPVPGDATVPASDTQTPPVTTGSDQPTTPTTPTQPTTSTNDGSSAPAPDLSTGGDTTASDQSGWSGHGHRHGGWNAAQTPTTAWGGQSDGASFSGSSDAAANTSDGAPVSQADWVGTVGHHHHHHCDSWNVG
ncbi:family 16 glycosylhydrolase [Alsobacter sp. KACC 23698]|uniref:glycoside hydrolase family 16 protein n=1 Tax=Alsobacter sp. KACC 23698 TaxID=3149229 RepID=UPI003877D98E